MSDRAYKLHSFPEGMTLVRVDSVKPDPNNPRVIKDSKFRALCDSIEKDPEFMTLRPIVANKNSIIKGGNQRHKALLHMGYEFVPADWIRITSLSDAKMKRFLMMDNNSMGEFNWDMVLEQYTPDDLAGLGFDVWEVPTSADLTALFKEDPEFKKKERHEIVLRFDSKKDMKFVEKKLLEAGEDYVAGMLQILRS